MLRSLGFRHVSVQQHLRWLIGTLDGKAGARAHYHAFACCVAPSPSTWCPWGGCSGISSGGTRGRPSSSRGTPPSRLQRRDKSRVANGVPTSIGEAMVTVSIRNMPTSASRRILCEIMSFKEVVVRMLRRGREVQGAECRCIYTRGQGRGAGRRLMKDGTDEKRHLVDTLPIVSGISRCEVGPTFSEAISARSGASHASPHSPALARFK